MKLSHPLKRLGVVAALVGAMTGSVRAADLTQSPREDWPTYGGSFNNQRFSQLDQVTPGNVRGLRVKWTFRFAMPGNRRPPWRPPRSS